MVRIHLPPAASPRTLGPFRAKFEHKLFDILRLSGGRSQDKALLHSLLETMCAIANVGPGTDGFLYIGIADKPQDAARIAELDTIHPIIFEHLQIVGIEREAKVMGISLEHYMRILQDTITNSRITEPLKTQLGSSIDVINYKAMLVVRLWIPKQTGLPLV